MTRQSKTPAQRAQEALDVEQRRLAKLTKLRDSAKAEYERLDADHQASLARRNYLLQHPDLPKQRTPSPTGEPTA